MTDEPQASQFIARRALVVSGVKQGIHRRPGTLIITRHRLAFLPATDGDDEVLQALLDCDQESSAEAELTAILSAARSRQWGVLLDRDHPELTAPDADGRLHLLPLGQEDDLLVPYAEAPLVATVLGPDHQSMAGVPRHPNRAAPVTPVDGPAGWIGPVTAVTSTALSLLAVPLLAGFAVAIAESGDEDVATVIFLMGSAILALSHLGTIGAAALGFQRGERTRMWGLATLPFALLSMLVLLVGCAISLEKLF